MTGPVTWFSTDVLTGAGLDVPKGELRLAPGMTGEFPLYYPGFWAMLSVTKEKVSLKILKTFDGKNPIRIKTIVVEPMGQATDDGRRIALPSAFVIEKGAVLDLSRSELK